MVRPHSDCLTGEVFGSQRRDCGPQMREAVERTAEAGGYLLYLRRKGGGSACVCVTQRVPMHVHLSAANARYLITKARRGARTLDVASVSARL